MSTRSKRINLNADLGESFGAWRMGRDDEMLQVVASANVACGFHAGDPVLILDDGTTLFGGSILVDSTTMSASFSPGLALSGFGPDPANGNLFTWDDTTLLGLSLGVFQPGQTKTLTYLVSSQAMTVGQCTLTPFACPLALTGFGDPPPGNGGVIIVPNSAAASSFSAFSLSGNTSSGRSPFSLFSVSFKPASEVPLPPAIFLFGAGLAALGGAMKRRAGAPRP